MDANKLGQATLFALAIATGVLQAAKALNRWLAFQAQPRPFTGDR